MRELADVEAPLELSDGLAAPIPLLGLLPSLDQPPGAEMDAENATSSLLLDTAPKEKQLQWELASQ